MCAMHCCVMRTVCPVVFYSACVSACHFHLVPNNMPQNTTPAPTLQKLANSLTSSPVGVDCFFVTLGTTVDEIARRIGIPVPQAGSSYGVSVRQIIDGLTSLGLVFRV